MKRTAEEECDIWVRLESEGDDEAHIVTVPSNGFVAHIIKCSSEQLAIEEKLIKHLSLGGAQLSNRTKIEELNLNNIDNTFVVHLKDPPQKVPSLSSFRAINQHPVQFGHGRASYSALEELKMRRTSKKELKYMDDDFVVLEEEEAPAPPGTPGTPGTPGYIGTPGHIGTPIHPTPGTPLTPRGFVDPWEGFAPRTPMGSPIPYSLQADTPPLDGILVPNFVPYEAPSAIDSTSAFTIPPPPVIEPEEGEGQRKLCNDIFFNDTPNDLNITIELKLGYAHKTNINTIFVPLSTTLGQLKNIIKLQEGIGENSQSVAVDLHVTSHPLIFHKKTENTTLAKLGFGQLFSKHNADDMIMDNKVLFVVLRTLGNNSQVQEWGLCKYSPAWMPFGSKQSSEGMMIFLSAMYVLSNYLSRNTEEAKVFLGNLYHLTRFPPAILAFHYLIQNKKIYAEQKAALSNTLFHLFRKFVPYSACQSDSDIFKHTLKCIGFLQIENFKLDVSELFSFQPTSLTCSVTGAPLSYPVRLKDSKKNRVFNKQIIVDSIPGGRLYMENGPFSIYTVDSIVDDPISKFLLLSYSLSDDIIWMSTLQNDIYGGALDTQYSTQDYTKLQAKVAVSTKTLRFSPPLSLKNAIPPLLTYDDMHQPCVYTGPEPCSVGTVVLLNLFEDKIKRVNPDILAKQLGHFGESVDHRDVQEAIFVCLDVSGSMEDYSFSEKENEDEKIIIELTNEEVMKELANLKNLDGLPIYKSLFQQDSEEVFKELSKSSTTMGAIVDKHKDKLYRILAHPFQEVMMDKATWPKNSNYLLWLPDSILSHIYSILKTLEPLNKEKLYSLPTPNNPFPLIVKCFNSKSWRFLVDKTFTIDQIIRALEPSVRYPNWKLVKNGKSLETTRTLSFYNITEPESVIFAIYSLNPRNKDKDSSFEDMSDDDSDVELSITTEMDYQRHKITVQRDKSVDYLKLKLWESLGLKPSENAFWQGCTDNHGWEEKNYIDESYFLNVFNERDEPIYYGPRDNKRTDQRMSRLNTVKQLFHAFINRSQAYNYPNHIGLILFNNKTMEVCPLTPLFEEFRKHIDLAYANGGTNLYGAIARAGELLSFYKVKFPSVQTRILCLSDGEDTLHKISPENCAKMLRANGIVLDAIMIGDGKDNHILRAMAKSTGGYAFAPQSLTEALNINELETMLSLSERPPIDMNVKFNETVDLKEFANLQNYPINLCTREVVPTRKTPFELEKPVVSLEEAIGQATKHMEEEIPISSPLQPQQNAQKEQNRNRRLLSELRSLQRDPHPNFDIYPNATNIAFWQIVLEVTEGSHYSGGTWLLYAEFPPDYPRQAPEIRFMTPIRHSNVNQYGKICHSIFSRNWTADTSMQTVLNCIYGLMLNPDTDDPLDTNLALSYFSATGDYEAKILAHVELYAKQKDRIAWRKHFQSLT